MASWYLRPRADVPNGTTVDVYPLSQFPKGNMNKTPTGSPTDSRQMTSTGVTFRGLREDVQYAATFIATNGERISIKFYIPLEYGLVSKEELDDAIEETAGRVRSEVHDDFTQAEPGDFTARVADSGQAYVISGDTTPTIEEVEGYNVLSIANATASGIHSFYLEQALSSDCRYVFAKVMFAETDDEYTTDDSAIALATPPTSIATTPDAGYDIGAHAVFSASGGLEASTWVDMNSITSSDLDGSNLYGSASAPTPNEPTWCGWILCENGTLLVLAPDGTLTETRDTRYIINSGPFAWIEPFLTAGDTDVRPYGLEWAAGCSVSEAAAAHGDNDELAQLIFAAETVQSNPDRIPRGDKVTNAATIADTNETDLHTYNVSGGTLGANGDKIHAKFAGQTGANGNDKRIRVYFGGTAIFDTTAQAFNNVHWCVDVTIIRVSATSYRVIATGIFGTVPLATYTEVTDVAAASAQVLKLTGLNGTANAGDITARLSTWEKAHAA